MRRVLVAAIAAVLLSGCVTAKATMLDDRTAIISGRGNNFTSQADVLHKVLIEAATTAQARGYRYFVIESSQDTTRRGTAYFPGQTTTTGSVSGVCATAVCTGNYRSQSYTSPGSAVPIVKPGADVQVRFYREGEIDPSPRHVWDTQSVLAEAVKK